MGEKHLNIRGVNRAGSGETVLWEGNGICYGGEISCTCRTEPGNGPERGLTYVIMSAQKNYYDVMCMSAGDSPGVNCRFRLKAGDTCD